MNTNIYNFTNDVNELVKDENGNHKLNYLRTDEYYFHPVKHSILTIERNKVKKNIRIIEDNEFVFKVQKTQVKARGGAEKLAEFLADPEWRLTAVKLLDCMMDTVKQATIHPWEY